VVNGHAVSEVGHIQDPQQRARAANRLLAEHQALLNELARLRRQAISDLRRSGLTQAQVAQVLGVSPGRVSQVEHAAAQDDQQPASAPAVLVERAIPTTPSVRGSRSLYLTETERQGVVPTRTMLYVGPEPAAPEVAKRLGINPGASVLARRKLFFANDIPIRIATSYFTLSFTDGTALADPDFVEGGFQVVFDRMGVRFGHATETLTARMPSKEEVRILQLDKGVPVVEVLRSSYDVDGRPVHTLETICAADRHVFVINQMPDDIVF